MFTDGIYNTGTQVIKNTYFITKIIFRAQVQDFR